MKRLKFLSFIICISIIISLFNISSFAAGNNTSMNNATQIYMNNKYTVQWNWNDYYGYSDYYYKFSITETGILTFTGTKPKNLNGENVQLNVDIYDNQGNSIFDTKSTFGISDVKNYYSFCVGLSPGEYYIGLGVYGSGLSQISLNTVFDISFEQNNYCEIEPNETMAQSQFLTLGKEYKAFVSSDGGYRDDNDYYRLKLLKGITYKIAIGNYEELALTSTIVDFILQNGEDFRIDDYFSKNVDEYGKSYYLYTPETTGIYGLRFSNYFNKQVSITICVSEYSNNGYNNDSNNSSNNANNNSSYDDSSNNNLSKNDNTNNNIEKFKYSNEWIDGKWYNSDGTCTYTGKLEWKNNSIGWWIEDTTGWYPVSSWQKIDGKWYYFSSSGYMASNEYVDGYWINGDGSMSNDYYLMWKSNTAGWWAEDKSGWWPSLQWLKVDGCWYYFDASGYMVTNKYIDGYWIGSNGVCQ